MGTIKIKYNDYGINYNLYYLSSGNLNLRMGYSNQFSGVQNGKPNDIMINLLKDFY